MVISGTIIAQIAFAVVTMSFAVVLFVTIMHTAHDTVKLAVGC